jgi:hypothetical protein
MCKHTVYETIATHGFGGPVSRDEHPAAHGNICDTEQCCDCGARRRVNVNQRHREEGPWGPSRSEREAEACRLREVARVVGRPAPMVIVHPDGRRLTLAVDSEGYLYVSGARHDDADLRQIYAAFPAFLADTRRYRAAVIAAEQAEAEVA